MTDNCADNILSVGELVPKVGLEALSACQEKQITMAHTMPPRHKQDVGLHLEPDFRGLTKWVISCYCVKIDEGTRHADTLEVPTSLEA
jgi:hypothetical protein